MRQPITVLSNVLTALVVMGLTTVAIAANTTKVEIVNGATVVSLSNPLPVAATITPGGTQNVNLIQVGGASVALGQALAASSIPVVLPAATNVPIGVNTGNANTQAHICGSVVTKHITTATDTQLVAASGSTTIYVCDYEISFGGTTNIFLEKATTGTCATLTQIGQTWYGAANAGKAAGNAFYRGLNTGASAQLCADTSAGQPVDITVYYDQY